MPRLQAIFLAQEAELKAGAEAAMAAAILSVANFYWATQVLQD